MNELIFFSCKVLGIGKRFMIFLLLIFLSPTLSMAQFAEGRNDQLEKRLHRIYVENYSKPILDSDWFKIVDSIEEQTYTVRSGDTLWSISKVYFGDGFYWSKLWSVNKTITNPHLIYVGDLIHFKSGSFDSAPDISVEKAKAGEVENTLAVEEMDPEGMIQISKVITKATPISALFIESTPLLNKKSEPILIEDRPPVRLNMKSTLTEELLNRRPAKSGEIYSLGKNRNLSAENEILFIRSYDGLNNGEVLSVLEDPIDNMGGGYRIKIQATVRVEKNVESNIYQARVLQQYSSILVGSTVTPYQAQEYDTSINGPISNARAKIVATNERVFWGQGEVVFLKGEDSNLSPGEVLSLKNPYDPKIDAFYNSGLLKVISTSPPYATAVVLQSQAEVTQGTITGL